jgi:hypothetical protein
VNEVSVINNSFRVIQKVEVGKVRMKFKEDTYNDLRECEMKIWRQKANITE